MRRVIEAKIVNFEVGAGAALPSYATDGSAGLDLRACLAEPLLLGRGSRHLFKTGLALNIMDPGVVAIVASRSGLSLKYGIRVAQGVGVIDADYHGEIGVILANDGSEDYLVQPGERIAQLLFMPVIQCSLRYVSDFSTETNRGTEGFGSTGTD
jgi:dUTP pyrophosphatase